MRSGPPLRRVRVRPGTSPAGSHVGPAGTDRNLELADGLVGLGDDPDPGVPAERRSCSSSTWSGDGAAVAAPKGVSGCRKTSRGFAPPAAAAATRSMPASNSSRSVSAPITIFTQVVAPPASAAARNSAWVVGRHRPAVDAPQLQVHAHEGDGSGQPPHGGHEGSVRLEHDRPAAVGERSDQPFGPGALEERFAAGDADRVVGDLAPQAADGVDHPVDGERAGPDVPVAAAGGHLHPARPGSALERLGLVAVGAADVAAGQSDEHLPFTDECRLALDGGEDLRDEDVVRSGSGPPAGGDRAGSGSPLTPAPGRRSPAAANPRARSTACVARPARAGRHRGSRTRSAAGARRVVPSRTISSLEHPISGVRMAIGSPSTPRRWPVAATPRKASMNSGRQSG